MRNTQLAASPSLNPALPAAFYSKNFTVDPWWYGNYTYNSTAMTTFIAGNVSNNARALVKPFACPDAGCNTIPPEVVDVRDGILRWSDNVTWESASPPMRKPLAGDNVTIPYGWDLVIDEDIPLLNALVINGNVTFNTTKPITVRATYILVTGRGVLSAGAPDAPHPAPLTILLNGTRDVPQWAVSNTLNLGAKFLAAVGGGRIDLHGTPVARRWTRLAATAPAGATTITLAQGNLGWPVGSKVLITSTSWNPWQAEVRTITAVSGTDGTVLTLDEPLVAPHTAKIVSLPGSGTGDLDMRAEVALVSSTINVGAIEGIHVNSAGGEHFGCRVIGHGESVLRLSQVTMNYCGQGGLDRAAVLFKQLTAINSTANPSWAHSIVSFDNQDAGVEVDSAQGNPITVQGSVFYKSYDRSTVIVNGTGNVIQDNLALGTIKVATNNQFDRAMPSTFWLLSSNNTLTNNVAAGSERVGFMYHGQSCSVANRGQFNNNVAHSNGEVVGQVLPGLTACHQPARPLPHGALSMGFCQLLATAA